MGCLQRRCQRTWESSLLQGLQKEKPQVYAHAPPCANTGVDWHLAQAVLGIVRKGHTFLEYRYAWRPSSPP